MTSLDSCVKSYQTDYRQTLLDTGYIVGEDVNTFGTKTTEPEKH
jgi:hypothetical protein